MDESLPPPDLAENVQDNRAQKLVDRRQSVLSLMLNMAVGFQDKDIVKMLLDNGAKPTGVSFQSYCYLRDLCSEWSLYTFMETTPLHIATRKSLPWMCDYLLSEGIDPNIQDSQGRTVLWETMKTGNYDRNTSMFDFWIGKTPLLDIHHLDKAGESVLFNDSWTREWISMARRLLELGVDPNIRNLSTGDTCLHNALARYQPRFVKLLLEQTNLDVNVQNKNGDTPLHVCVQLGQGMKMLKFFLDHGVSLYLKNNQGKMPKDVCRLPLERAFLQNKEDQLTGLYKKAQISVESEPESDQDKDDEDEDLYDM